MEITRRSIGYTAGAVALVAAFVAVVQIGPIWAEQEPAAPAPTSLVEETEAPEPTPTFTPTPTPEPVVEAPAPPPPPPAPPASSGAPSGTPLPGTVITDPNNGNYGQMGYPDPGTYCASHSASTVNGVPTCD